MPPDQSPQKRSDMHAALEAMRGGDIEDGGELDAVSALLSEAAGGNADALKQALADVTAAGGGRTANSWVNVQWLSCAVAGPSGVLYADAGFRIGAGDAGSDIIIAQLRDLARRAMRGRRVFAMQHIGQRRRAMAVAAPSAMAAQWPMPDEARTALAAPGSAAIMVFAPSHADGFTASIERMFDLTPAEARVCSALFQADTIREAAAELGISSATTREHVGAILRKTGSTRRAGLIARVTEVLAGDYMRSQDRKEVMREAFALTLAEARVADASAQGLTAPEIAAQIGVSVHTVRAQLDAALTKTGARRAADLARMACEISVLAAWSSCEETQRSTQQTLITATRIIPASGRQIAAADYGPPGGHPVLCFHAGYRYRWVRRQLRHEMMARGLRPVSFDLPGCGLSDANPDMNLFDAAAQDAERVLDALKIRRVSVYAEFGGAIPAVAFAALRPDMIDQAVMVMPRPVQRELIFPGAVQNVYSALVAKPDLAHRFYEAMRVRGGPRFWGWVQRQISKGVAADRAAMADPGFLAERVSEMNAACARSSDGVLALDWAHRQGWTPAGPVGGRRWTIVETAISPFGGNETPEQAWGFLPGLSVVKLPDAGRLADHTHAGAIADIFVDATPV